MGQDRWGRSHRAGGTLEPGDVDFSSFPTPGILNAGATTLSAASTFAVVLDGATTAGTDYNQLNASGSVTLGNAALSVTPGYTPTAGDTYTIMTSATGISGTFAGLPDGSTLCANDYLFRVNYTSTDVTLTAVGPAPASHFEVSMPSSTTAGSAFSFTITALDACNNAVPSYAGTVHFTSSDGQSLLPADATFAGGAGTFSATLDTAGSQTITATDTVTSSITGSSTIVVGPTAATHFVVSAPATATAGNAISLTVTALDQFNNTATGYAGTVHFATTDGAATLPANSTLTGGSGTFSATLKTPGAQTITATDTVSSSITGSSSSIAVSAAAATHFAVSAPATATAGAPFSFTVTALDPFNNTATGYAGTVHFTSSGAATLPVNSTLTSGVGTFSAALDTAGSQTITATDSVTSSITGISNTIVVGATAATHLAVSAPATATAGSAFSFTVTALDAFNNTATGYAGTVHFTSSDGAATLPADAALTSGARNVLRDARRHVGTQTITATDSLTRLNHGNIEQHRRERGGRRRTSR